MSKKAAPKKKKPDPPLDLPANPDNPRRISGRQLAMLRKSMEEYGDLGGIIKNITSGTLIGGHQRTRIIQKDRKATIEYTGRNEQPDAHGTVAWGWIVSGDQRFSYREVKWAREKESAAMIAANKHGGDWDMEKLKALVQRELADIDPDLLGFDDDEFTALLASTPAAGKTDPDDVPDPPEIPTTELGDVWILGDHRLVCGDSEDAKTAKLALNKRKVKLMVTDPPYGVNYDASWRIGAGATGSGTAVGKVLNDHRADWRKAYAHFPGDVAYVWHAGIYADAVSAGLQSCAFEIRSQIIWDKGQLVMGRGDYHWQHEPCWYAVRKGRRGHYNGDRTQTTVWDIKPGPGYNHPADLFTIGGTGQSTTIGTTSYDAFEIVNESAWLPENAAGEIHRSEPGAWIPLLQITWTATDPPWDIPTTVWDIPRPAKNETGHSTQKPVECMLRPMLNNSVPGDGIYEPFSGSGTTIIAGEMSGRRVHAIELSPIYVDVDVVRWQNFTGREAIHESTGKTFATLKKEREK